MKRKLEDESLSPLESLCIDLWNEILPLLSRFSVLNLTRTSKTLRSIVFSSKAFR